MPRRPAKPQGPAATYDAAAESYEGALSVNAGAARRLVASIPAGPVHTMVDLGCGTGFASLAAIDLLAPADVVGVDASPGMLGRYRDAVGSQAARVRALEAPVAAVPLPNGVADVVVATMVLQWVDDRAAALAESARLLRPGGWLGLVVPAVGTDREFHDVVRALDPPAPAPWLEVERSRTIAPDALLDMLEASGFEVGDWWIEERSRAVAPAELVERMRLVGAHVFPEPATDPDIWARVGAALHARSPEGCFAYTFSKLFTIATRS